MFSRKTPEVKFAIVKKTLLNKKPVTEKKFDRQEVLIQFKGVTPWR